jgi:acylglycerol lipase
LTNLRLRPWLSFLSLRRLLIACVVFVPALLSASGPAWLPAARGESPAASAAGQIASSCWADPDVEAKAAMLCIHGLSLHRGTYAEFGKEISRAGIVAYAIDLRGFGELQAKTRTTSMDFDGCLSDIKQTLEQIHRQHPGLPVVILGESMGGAIALRAAALYPKLISGLISSAPARDRFSLGGESVLKVGAHVLTGGMGTRIKNVAAPIVKRVSSKEEVRSRWHDDPLMRTDFSARELMQFNEFMAGNLEYATEIKDMPVLFIIGSNDKLIKPAGTWRIFEKVSSARKQLVLSKNSEHLIFEAGQFNVEDMSFVRTWINNNVAKLNPHLVASQKQQPAVAAAGSAGETFNKSGPSERPLLAQGTVPSAATASTAAIYRPNLPAAAQQIDGVGHAGLSYWIEMSRGGKIFRCNNKTEFRSGDQIRFHVIPASDGYAYLVMVAGTSGKSVVLFPSPESGQDNYLKKGRDYAVPGGRWLQFDETPGIEKLSLLVSKQPMDVSPELFKKPLMTCYVSAERDGAKDIVPTRMKLSWDDPKPVALPDDFAAGEQIASYDKSLVRLVSSAASSYLTVEIALIHR